MGLYEQFKKKVEAQDEKAFWDAYFAQEKSVYEKILENVADAHSGKLGGLAASFNMEPALFAGFLDGINTSLKTPLDIDALTEESDVALDVDFQKLYFNMLEAKADWLYTLPQWDGVLSDEKRREIAKNWRASKMAVSSKVERNAPCPCGSGLKYKKCCGKNA